jgi:hypothetical protein
MRPSRRSGRRSPPRRPRRSAPPPRSPWNCSAGKAKSKGAEETRPQKRVKEEQSAVKGTEQKPLRKTVAPPKPDYRLMSPDEWNESK